MSALTDYVTELRRQYELLDRASDRDSDAESLVYSDSDRERRRLQKRPRVWTRQDIRRCEVENLVAEYRLDDLDPLEGAPSIVDVGRHATRVATLLRFKNWLPDVRQFHALALADAAKQGIYSDLLPLVQECTEAHLQLSRAFEIGTLEGEPHDWKEIEGRWGDAIERLEAAATGDEDEAEAEMPADRETDGGSAGKRKRIEAVDDKAKLLMKRDPKVRRARKRRELTKAGLAKLIGCDERTLAKTEAWIDYEKERGPRVVGRRKVALTEKIEATAGIDPDNAETWEEYYAQGDPDDMPSPCDNRPARIYSNHRRL